MGSGKPVAIRGYITFTNKFLRSGRDSWLRASTKAKLRRIGNKKMIFSTFHHDPSPFCRLKPPIHHPIGLPESKCPNRGLFKSSSDRQALEFAQINDYLF